MRFAVLGILVSSLAVTGAEPDWKAFTDEAMRHYQALVRMDTTNPPGNETRAVEYLKKVLEAEGIPFITAGAEPARLNLIARLKGSGSKKPVLLMGHTDTVSIDPKKWVKHGPFSADRDGGYVYGRGTNDDKDSVVAYLMVMLTLKRLRCRSTGTSYFWPKPRKRPALTATASSGLRITTRMRSHPSSVSLKEAGFGGRTAS